MAYKLLQIIIVALLFKCIFLIDVPEQQSTLATEEKKLSEYVLQILDHYKQKDPIGVPGVPIPDPMPIPPLTHSISVGRMNFKDVKLYGLKKFRIDHVNVDVAAMKVEAALKIDQLQVFGNYTLSTWLSKAQGPFTSNLTKVYVKAIATMEIERDGQLEAQEINMDITFKDIKMDFQGLGFFASVMQNVMNSVGTFVFDSIKPFILAEANTNIRKDVNEKVKTIDQKFPNSISPLDQLVAEVRKKVRNAGYDPYYVNDYNTSVGIFDINLSHTWVYGISSFHRTKKIFFEIRNHTVHALIEVGTQRMLGTSHWEILLAGMMSRAGTVSFSVEYIRVQLNISQAMDVRNVPALDDIQLDIGNIQVRFNGLGTIDYVIEFAVNIMPNLLRQQIMDALEKPIKLRIQEILSKVNLERIIKENVHKLDNKTAMEFLVKRT